MSDQPSIYILGKTIAGCECTTPGRASPIPEQREQRIPDCP